MRGDLLFWKAIFVIVCWKAAKVQPDLADSEEAALVTKRSSTVAERC